MANEAVAQPVAAPAAAPTPDAFDAAIQRVEARREAEEAVTPKDAGAGSVTAHLSPANPAAPAANGADRVRPRDISALAQREWRARQLEQEAQATRAKYEPLAQANAKRDLAGILATLAKEGGYKFSDFVEVLTQEKPGEPAPETAEQIVARKLAERDTAQAAAQREATAREYAQREANIRSQCQGTAEKGAADNADRWELTAISGKGGEAWDVIAGHYEATTKLDPQGRVVEEGAKLSIEQALDLIEAKLKEKQAARRPAPVAANGREAAGSGLYGKAATPSFTNRATSGIPAVVGAQAVDESALPEREAIARAAARVGIRL